MDLWWCVVCWLRAMSGGTCQASYCVNTRATPLLVFRSGHLERWLERLQLLPSFQLTHSPRRSSLIGVSPTYMSTALRAKRGGELSGT